MSTLNLISPLGDSGLSFIIHVPIYDRDVAICGDKYDLPLVGIDTTEWLDPHGTCQARSFMNNDDGTCGIIFREYEDVPPSGLIAHECLHVVNFIMHRTGFQPDRMNDEPDAYLLQYIVSAVHGVYHRIQSLKTIK